MKRPLRVLPLTLRAAALAALVAAPAASQAVEQAPSPTYRSVGPDGKVTFSDRLPTDPKLRTREVGKTLTAPLLTAGTEPFDLRPATALAPARPPAEGLTPAVDVSGRPFAPGLPDAILDVVVHQFFVQALAETCSRLHPAFSERYHGAVRNWRDRNAELLAKSNRITFARFTGEQRDTIRSTGRARLAQLMPAGGTDDADMQSWCDRMSTDLARHRFELVGDMRTAPIVYVELP
jgi:hypothetical protein